MNRYVLCSFAALFGCIHAAAGQSPKLADDRLQLTLFAETPAIVTPIGMVIDSRDRIFVIESHTHHPPADYDGPTSDRIKVFVDSDNDGKADDVSVFADGIHQAMNLAVAPGGDLSELRGDRGRDSRCRLPPAQIRT